MPRASRSCFRRDEMTPNEDRSRPSALLLWSVTTFYRLLLACYPRDVRREVERDAIDLFGEACASDWRNGGVGPLARRLFAALFSVPTSGWAEWRQRRSYSAASARGDFGPALNADVKHALRS